MTTLLARDRQAVWHPYTQHQTEQLPIAISRAEGAYLFDQEGKAYLDLVSSWWLNIHGHAHPEIAKAIYQQALQLEQVIFAGFTHEPAVAVAEQLLKLLPAKDGRAYSKVFYSDNGSTAVEVALKMAYQYWYNQGETKRSRFLAFSGGYHGDTFGAMAVSGSSNYAKAFADLLFEVDYAPYPATWLADAAVDEKEEEALQWIEKYFAQYRHEMAAVIIEPLIQGASGMRLCRPSFLKRLEDLAKHYEVLTIYDEVMTGFGRTGANFACERAGTQPDIICLAKGLTGGFLPLAVTVCQEAIYQAFLNPSIEFALLHGHSFTANPLGCAAALASLKLLADQESKAQRVMIENTHQQMLASLVGHPGVENLRYCGTLAALDLKAETSYGSALTRNIRQAAMERGFLIRPLGKVAYFLPPYCITEAELRNAYQALIEIIEHLVIKEKI